MQPSIDEFSTFPTNPPTLFKDGAIIEQFISTFSTIELLICPTNPPTLDVVAVMFELTNNFESAFTKNLTLLIEAFVITPANPPTLMLVKLTCASLEIVILFVLIVILLILQFSATFSARGVAQA